MFVGHCSNAVIAATPAVEYNMSIVSSAKETVVPELYVVKYQKRKKKDTHFYKDI